MTTTRNKTWGDWTFGLVMVAFWGAMTAGILWMLFRDRACADPNSWQQGSFGRFVAECEAQGGEARANAYRKTLTCEKTTTVKLR